jgi:HK97 family phage major capsid protein
MIGLQEMTDKTKERESFKQMKERLETGVFDYEEFNIFGTGSIQREQRIEEMKNAEKNEIWESLRKIPLKEFIARSGTDGIAGAYYLIPTKIYQTLFDSAVEEDNVAWLCIGGRIIPAEEIGGTTMLVDIAEDNSYVVKPFSSGGQMPTETIKTIQATLDFSTTYGINFRITNDLIEDSQFELIDMHIRNAGREMGEYANYLALSVLKTATDGDGTVNGGASGSANETKFTGGTVDLCDLDQLIHNDGYKPNKIVLTHEAWYHSIVSTAHISTSTYSEPWAYNAIVDGAAKKMLGCDCWYSTSSALYTLESDGTWDDCVTIMFDDRYALLTGRKRWLRIENYSEPIRDLVGATISMRQDSVTVYNDSIGVITETAG